MLPYPESHRNTLSFDEALIWLRMGRVDGAHFLRSQGLGMRGIPIYRLAALGDRIANWRRTKRRYGTEYGPATLRSTAYRDKKAHITK